jgi:hypothetical protein
MKNISILVPESSVMQAICDPQYLFLAVNNFLQAAGKPALFDVKLVGATREVKLANGHYSVHVDQLLGEVERTDLIFIPALFGDFGEPLCCATKTSCRGLWSNTTKAQRSLRSASGPSYWPTRGC